MKLSSIRNLIKQEKHIKCIHSAFLFLGCKNLGLRDLRFTKPAYTKKNNVLMPKVHKTCIYSKIKSFDSEKSPSLHVRKNKSDSMWDSLAYMLFFDLFDFSEYRFGDFSLSKLVIFLSICRLFAHQNVVCFEYMQVLWTLVKIMHFLLLMQVLERYRSQNLQTVCNFEVNKA